MESKRLEKVNQLLQEELSDIFRQEASKMKQGLLISVTEVRTTPDLSIAKAYLSVFPSKYGKEAIHAIKESNAHFRKLLGNRIGKVLRIVPELNFYLDLSIEKADSIDKALKGQGEQPEL